MPDNKPQVNDEIRPVWLGLLCFCAPLVASLLIFTWPFVPVFLLAGLFMWGRGKGRSRVSQVGGAWLVVGSLLGFAFMYKCYTSPY